MLTYLIQVVGTSLSTGILVALLFTMACHSGNRSQVKWLLSGAFTGAALSVIVAILKTATAIINREFFNIAVFSVAILFGILFIFLSFWGLKKNRAAVETKGGWAVAAILTAFLLLYCLPDILIYPTQFLVSGQSVFSTDFLFKLIGYLAGLVIVGLSVTALFKAGISLSANLVRVLLAIGLAVNMVSQISTIVQYLLARRIIPMQKWIFEFVKISVNYSAFFLYFLMAVTIILPVLLWAKSLHPTESYENPAQHRKIRASARNKRRWCAVMLAGYLLSALSLTALKAYDEREVVLSPAEPMNIVGSTIVISLENVNDGNLHRFSYTASDGTEVRFIVIKKNASSFGVGLDACDICGETGYYQRNDEVICKRCDVVMNRSTIGFKGGCNPVPLAYSIDGGSMVIQTQSLEKEKGRFD